VHYTRKKAKKPAPGQVAAGLGGVQKKQRKQGLGKPEKKKKNRQQQTTSST
jgi:ribosomal protein L34E